MRRRPIRILGATVHTFDRRSAKRNALKAILAEHRRRPFDVIHARALEYDGIFLRKAT